MNTRYNIILATND